MKKILKKIWEFIQLNLSRNRTVMFTFQPRNTNYGNEQADGLGKCLEMLMKIFNLSSAYRAREGNPDSQFGDEFNPNSINARSFEQLNINRPIPQKRVLSR